MIKSRLSRRTPVQPSHLFFVYAIGFTLSILLTIASFWFSYTLEAFAMPAIVLAAIIQLMVQLIFFLHLGESTTPKSYAFVFFFTVLIVGILIGGTIWIMNNLAHLHMQQPTIHDLYEHDQVLPQNERH